VDGGVHDWTPILGSFARTSLAGAFLVEVSIPSVCPPVSLEFTKPNIRKLLMRKPLRRTIPLFTSVRSSLEVRKNLLWYSGCNIRGINTPEVDLNSKGWNMTRVLELQQLSPKAGDNEMDLILVSTYSSICPTNGPAGEGRFQME